MTRPLDFLLVGAPRSGTTSLFRHLNRHPEIFVPAAKELPFFTNDAWGNRDWSAYVAKYFASAGTSQRWGKLTPQYWDRPEVPPRLRASMPDLRLLVLLRNPIDRAFSHYRFLVRRGVEPQPFAEVAFDQTARKYCHYTPLSEYARILKAYLACFSSQQILVLFTEDLAMRPQRVLGQIHAYLDLTAPFPSEGLERRFNVGGTSTHLPWLVPFVRRTPLRRLWRVLPEGVRQAIGKWYFFEIAPKTEAPPPLATDLRQRLVEHFRPQVTQLEEILERPVPWQELRQ